MPGSPCNLTGFLTGSEGTGSQPSDPSDLPEGYSLGCVVCFHALLLGKVIHAGSGHAHVTRLEKLLGIEARIQFNASGNNRHGRLEPAVGVHDSANRSGNGFEIFSCHAHGVSLLGGREENLDQVFG